MSLLQEGLIKAAEEFERRGESTVRRSSFKKFCGTRVRILEKPVSDIQSDRQRRAIWFDLNRTQRLYSALKREGRRQGYQLFLLLKSRQEGYSTFECADSYQRVVERRYENCVILGQTATATAKLFRMIKLMADGDPYRPAGTTWTRTSLTCEKTGSELYIGTAGAKSFSRSATLSKVHGTEACHWEGNLDKKEDLLAGLTEACGTGETTLETTPKVDEMYYPRYFEALRGEGDWYPVFIAWWMNPNNTMQLSPRQEAALVETLTDEEKGLVEKYRLTPGQLAWRRVKHRRLRKRAYQEYPDDPDTAFLARGGQYFDPEVIRRERASANYSFEESGGWRRWSKPQAGLSYYLGVDTAEGKPDGDFSAICVLDQYAHQHAQFRARVPPPRLATEVVKAARYWNNALTVIERNNHGHLVIDRVMHPRTGDTHSGYTYLYCAPRWNGKKWVKTRDVGWLTDELRRTMLLNDLDEWLTERHLTILDPYFFMECDSFIWNSKKNRYEGVPHDDVLFSVGLALQGLKAPRVTAGVL